MTNPVHASLVSFANWSFRDIGIPESIKFVCENPTCTTVVVQSESFVAEGLLRALLSRVGFPAPRAVREVLADSGLSSPKGTRVPSSPQVAPPRLSWISVHDDSALGELIERYPDQRFVTLNVFYVRGPVRNIPSQRRSAWRWWALLFARHVAIIRFGEPRVFSRSFGPHHTGARSEHPTGDLAPAAEAAAGAGSARGIGKAVARWLKMDFYQNVKLVRGTPFQALDVQERSVLSGNEFERELSLYAQRQDISIGEARRKAGKEFRHIAANPRRILYGIAAPIVRFALRRLFTRITVQGLERLPPVVREHPVVLVPIHRSHLDYILLSSILYDSDLNPALVAAGVNLNFFPVGAIARGLGAYFVKRDSRHDRLHMLVLRRYVTYLVKRGHLQEFFIEGGRSRSGKMRAPKVGLLSVMVDAFNKRLRRDIFFLPVSLTYETVIEDSSFGEENTGVGKSKESLAALLRARKALRKKYGDVILSFGNPISLAAFAQRRESLGSDSRALVPELADHLVRQIRDGCALSLTALTFTALLMAPRYGLTRSVLRTTIENLAHLGRISRGQGGGELTNTPALEQYLAGGDHLLQDLVRGGVLSSGECLGEEVFFIPGERRFTADFYKNSAVHLFLIPSMLAMHELVAGPVRAEGLRPYHEIFALDLMLPSFEDFTREVSEVAERLRSAGVLAGDGVQGWTFASRAVGTFIPALLLPTVESYLWVLLNLKSVISPSGACSEASRKILIHPKAVEESESQKGLGATVTALNVTLRFGALVERLRGDFRISGYLSQFTRTEAAAMAALSSVLESLQQRKFLTLSGSGSKRDQLTVVRFPDGDIPLLERAHQSVREFLTSHGAGQGLRLDVSTKLGLNERSLS